MISGEFTLHCKSFLIFLQRTRTDPDRTLYVSPACASRKGFYNSALTWSWLLGLFPSPLCFSLNTCKKGAKLPRTSWKEILSPLPSACLLQTSALGVGSCAGKTELHHMAHVFNQNNSYFEYKYLKQHKNKLYLINYSQ